MDAYGARSGAVGGTALYLAVQKVREKAHTIAAHELGVAEVVFASRGRHTRLQGDWGSDVCSSDLGGATSRVTFSGLPGTIAEGQVLFEYTQDPLPPPIGAGRQVFRSVAVTNGAFRDWFGPHDAHV